MSSTGRGAERVANDNYPTPAWVTRAILRRIPSAHLAGRVLEPACGQGAITDEIVDHARPQVLHAVDVVDPRPPPLWVHGYDVADFLAWQPPSTSMRFDLVITNPPYALAQEFVDRARSLLAPGGLCVMLLRLNFLGSQRRAAWLRAWTPDVYVLPRRPSFTGRGTDSCEYAWCVWHEDRRGPRGSVEVLELEEGGR